MRLNNEIPSDAAPAPFTHDEWYDLFCCVGHSGGVDDSDGSATRAMKTIIRVAGKSYVTDVLYPRLVKDAEAEAESNS